MNLKWCIPSKGRCDYIKTKTLLLLEKHKIDKKDIYIFVAPDEIETYKDALPEYQIIEGAKGISKQRECISNHFDRNEFIVSIDGKQKAIKGSIDKEWLIKFAIQWKIDNEYND